MKKAVLVISFGTTYKETREKTIGACENKIKEALKGYDFFRAFTSNIIIKILKDRDGLHIESPIEVLNRLYKEGYKEVIVQSLHIICGEEFNKLRELVKEYKDKFEKITLGRPLLTYEDDYKDVVKALESQIPKMEEDEALIFMGHGTLNKSNSIYLELEKMLRDLGINVYIKTLEESKEIEKLIKILKVYNIKNVSLMPFMLVSGHHIKNDMLGENSDSWKSIFESYGFKVKIYLQGLGENTNIQEKFMRHAYDCIEDKVTKVVEVGY